MRILRSTFLPLLTVAVLFITSAPAMAGTFLTEICLSLHSTVFPTDTINSRVAVTNMGNNHFQLSGVSQFISTDPLFPFTSRTTSVSGAGEIRANGDIIMSVNSQVAIDDLPTGVSEADAISILLPAGGAGSWSDAISGVDSTVIAPPGASSPGSFQDEDHGTAAIVSCTGIGI